MSTVKHWWVLLHGHECKSECKEKEKQNLCYRQARENLQVMHQTPNCWEMAPLKMLCSSVQWMLTSAQCSDRNPTKGGHISATWSGFGNALHFQIGIWCRTGIVRLRAYFKSLNCLELVTNPWEFCLPHGRRKVLAWYTCLHAPFGICCLLCTKMWWRFAVSCLEGAQEGWHWPCKSKSGSFWELSTFKPILSRGLA